jgi:hypothetical protein
LRENALELQAMLGILLLTVASLFCSCHRPPIIEYTYSDHWQNHNGKSLEKLDTITRIRIKGSKARYENDFELFLFDQERHQLMAADRTTKTVQQLPVAALPQCPANEQLIQEYQCTFLPAKTGDVLHIQCTPAGQTWEIIGTKISSPTVLLQTLLATESISNECYCLLRDYPIDFSYLKSHLEKNPGYEDLELKREKITELPKNHPDVSKKKL